MDENENFLHFTVILVFQGLYLMLLFLSIGWIGLILYEKNKIKNTTTYKKKTFIYFSS